MTDRRGGTPQLRHPLVPVVLGAVIGMLGVLWAVGLGPAEFALILLPMLVGAAVAGASYLWFKRRGDL